MMKSKFSRVAVVILGASNLVFARNNPGSFVLTNHPVTVRPDGDEWIYQYSSSTYSSRFIDLYRSTGNTNPDSSISGQEISGFFVEAGLTSWGDGLSGGTRGDTQYIDQDIAVRYFAEYVPYGTESPVAPNDNVILRAERIDIGYLNLDPHEIPGHGTTTHHLGVFDDHASSNWQNAGGLFEVQAAEEWSGSVTLDDGHWILRATQYPPSWIHEVQESIVANGTPANRIGEIIMTLLDDMVWKVTWIDGVQMDRGFRRGDIDGDGHVGPTDVGRLSSAYGSTPTDPNWDRFADLDNDEEVGPSDAGILSGDYGNTTFDADMSLTKDLGFW